MKIACDPEVFLFDGKQIVSAIGKLGTKKCGDVAVEEDNVLAEFQIEPTTYRGTFVERVGKGIQAIKDVSGMDIRIQSSHTFTKEYLKSLSPKAFVFGCSTDRNAYTEAVNPKPNPYTNLRCGGGHLHIDVHKKRREQRVMIVKLLDLYLGVPSVLLDSDRARRRLYGKAGAYRPKQYGLEYRTLSNFWLRSDKLIGWVFDQTEKALETSTYVNCIPYAQVRRCIDTSDRGLAQKLIHRQGIQMP